MPGNLDDAKANFPLQNASPTDTGLYKIIAKNDAGDSQALVNLTVDADATIPSVRTSLLVRHSSSTFQERRRTAATATGETEDIDRLQRDESTCVPRESEGRRK